MTGGCTHIDICFGVRPRRSYVHIISTSRMAILLPQENVLLSRHTTMRTGGKAPYFFIVKNSEGLIQALIFSKNKNLPFFILGGGSNTVARDKSIHGVVIKIEIPGLQFEKKENDRMCVVAGAGEVWDHVVEETVERGLYGLENLSAIPGTVGAAPIQNIGAYGSEVKDTITWVEALDVQTKKTKIFSNEECVFGYRDSFFKTREGKQFIVTRVAFDLTTRPSPNISYRDLKEYFENKDVVSPSIGDIRNAVIDIRSRKLPDIRKIGTAGSFFKNPIASQKTLKVLIARHPPLKYHMLPNGDAKISAAWLLDSIGKWRGYRLRDAGVYERHALVLVNHGNATGDEILILADDMAKSIFEKTGIVLEREVVVI